MKLSIINEGKLKKFYKGMCASDFKRFEKSKVPGFAANLKGAITYANPEESKDAAKGKPSSTYVISFDIDVGDLKDITKDYGDVSILEISEIPELYKGKWIGSCSAVPTGKAIYIGQPINYKVEYVFKNQDDWEDAYYKIQGIKRPAKAKTAKPDTTDPSEAYRYASEVIKGRWPEGEKIIASDLWIAVDYARHVIKSRWPDIEKPILNSKDPSLAYDYARFVIKGRWPEAEKLILTSPRAAGYYAFGCIKKRWPAAEKVINATGDEEMIEWYNRCIEMVEGH